MLADPAAFAKKVHVLWLGVGTAEPERMRAGIRKLHASLTDAGIAHVYQESPGTDHEWQTWRRNLNDFARGSSARGNAPQALTREHQHGAPCGAANRPERLAAPEAQGPPWSERTVVRSSA